MKWYDDLNDDEKMGVRLTIWFLTLILAGIVLVAVFKHEPIIVDR